MAALPRLKCPLRLEPHQIQGLDCIHIFPVVQWLVKKALETREELAAQQRNSALHEFDKHGVTPEDRAFNAQLVGSTASVLTVQAEYCANRQLKAPTLENADEETRVQCTLLEYGQRYGASKVAMAKKKDGDKVRSVPSHACLCACLVHVCAPQRMHATCVDTLLRSAKHRFARLYERLLDHSVIVLSLYTSNAGDHCGAPSLQAQGGTSEEDLVAMEQKRVKAIMKKMTALEGAGEVSASVLGGIASMQSKEVQEMASAFAKEAAALQEALGGAKGGEQAHQRAVAALTKQKASTDAKLEAARAKHDELKAQHDEAEKALAKVQKYVLVVSDLVPARFAVVFNFIYSSPVFKL